ncbi:MAG: hypothetical protein WBQ25_22610 [Nitrososphaeraceae archaeon]
MLVSVNVLTWFMKTWMVLLPGFIGILSSVQNGNEYACTKGALIKTMATISAIYFIGSVKLRKNL